MSDKGKILLVDDQPENIAVLYSTLHKDGYEIFVANDGESALESVLESSPELILLDVMMPGLNGFEVCRKLKAAPQTREIPVVFMTALADTLNKLEGFEVGGVDYITKPFEHTEVLARIRAHLSLYRLQRELKEKNAELEERNAELDAFAHTVAHDLKNPLGVISGFATVVSGYCDPHVDEERRKMLGSIVKQVGRATDIIEALLLLAGTSRHSDLSTEPMDMADVVNRVLDRLSPMIEGHRVELVVADQWPSAVGYPIWVEEVWVNYVSNGIKYGGRPPRLELGAEPRDGMVRYWVQDNGDGLSDEQRARLFTPFTRLHHDRAEGHGLGLSIVQRIVTRLGGGVGVDSVAGQGSRFYFELPRYQESAPRNDLGVRLVDGKIVFD